MYHLLVDWKRNNEFFLEKEFREQGLDLTIHDIPNYSPADRTAKLGFINLYYKYTKLGFKAIKASKKNDILICWNFTTSIACAYLCKLLAQQRTILALNIIAPPRKKVGEFIRRKVFSPVMNGSRYFITINSEFLITDYSIRLKVNKGKFFVLNDPLQEVEIKEFNDSGDYVFIGGEGQRDWGNLFEACSKISEIKFLCIARRKNFDHVKEIPANVRMLFDTDSDTFYNHLAKSKLVAIPLKSLAPAGLIVLLRAAMMNKPVIATDTPSIRNYIENDKSGILVTLGNSKELAEKIVMLFNNSDLQKFYASNLLRYVKQNFTHKNYTETLIKILNDIRP